MDMISQPSTRFYLDRVSKALDVVCQNKMYVRPSISARVLEVGEHIPDVLLYFIVK